jgi:hypothetical protein
MVSVSLFTAEYSPDNMTLDGKTACLINYDVVELLSQ